VKKEEPNGKEDFAGLLAEKVREYQGKDFQKWYYWKKRLEKADPGNPLLEKGFRGLPYSWR